MLARCIRRNLVRLSAAFLLVLSLSFPVQAQSIGIRAAVNQAQQKPGKIVTFLLGAIGPAKINRVELIYGVSSNSCPELSLRAKPDLDPGYQVNARYDWNLESDDVFLPGMKLWWQWEIHDEAGNELLTEPQSIVIVDPKYTWQVIEQGPVSLYWSQGGLDFGKRLIDKAVRSMDRMAKNAGIRPTGDLRIVIYPTADDLRSAVSGVAEWTGGVTYPKLDVVLVGISAQDPYQWADRVISHELAHLLISMNYTNCSGDPLPLWLAEGLAEYAEGKMPQEQRDLLFRALDEERLPGLVSLNSTFPVDETQARLAYAHSRAVIEYLVENQGVEKLHTLLGRLQDGQATDLALRPLYGFDASGLDQAWRAFEGFDSPPELMFITLTLPPTITQTPTPRPDTPTPSPTSSPAQTKLATYTPSTSPQPAAQDSAGALVFLVPVGLLAITMGTIIVRYLLKARNN